MKIELDMHTHTLASGHAFSTIQEMAKAGAEKGLKLLGITEHTPGIPGTCDPIYFRNLHVVPRQMYGIELMLGAEINILDDKGNIDAYIPYENQRRTYVVMNDTLTDIGLASRLAIIVD